MNNKRVLKIVLIVLVLCMSLSGIALGGIFWYIHHSVQKYCTFAQQAYPHPADNIAALIDLMNSDHHSCRDRNRAIWTLGRLRDRSVLPALESVYTVQSCQHDKFLCQYELKKAIILCGGASRFLRQTEH